MAKNRWAFAALLALLPMMFACNDFLGTNRIVYQGYVIDGSTGQRLTGYSISIQSGDTEYEVEIDGNGRFTSDETRADSDFFVTVVATGYRPFEAIETAPNGGTVPARVRNREIVVFPEGLVSPALQIDIIDAADRQFALAGTVRLVPSNGVSNFDLVSTVSTGASRWLNDLDQQNQVITTAFTDSQVTIPEGTLIFGVNYRVDVFGVANFQPQLGATSVTGGFDIGRVVDLSSLSDAQPVLVTAAEDFCVGLPSLATIPGFTTVASFTYTEPVEFVDPDDVDNLIVSISDNNGAGITRNADPDDDERVVINGSTIELQWNPSEAYDAFDPSTDTLNSVTFSNLFGIRIRRVGSVGSATSIGSSGTGSSIFCQADP